MMTRAMIPRFGVLKWMSPLTTFDTVRHRHPDGRTLQVEGAVRKIVDVEGFVEDHGCPWPGALLVVSFISKAVIKSQMTTVAVAVRM